MFVIAALFLGDFLLQKYCRVFGYILKDAPASWQAFFADCFAQDRLKSSCKNMGKAFRKKFQK